MNSISRFKIAFISICMTFSVMYAQESADTSDGFYGNGTGRNLRAADNNAVQELVSRIAESYSSCFDGVEDYLLDEPAGSMTVAGMVINTYTNYIQSVSEREVLSQSPNTSVKRSISVNQVNEMFAFRRSKMEDMIHSAFKAEQAGKIDDALRYYNWSYYLLQSLPCSDTVSMDSNRLMDWIPFRIDEVLERVTFVKRKADDGNMELSIYYNGKPVTSIDYTYFDGKDWSNIFSAKDGIGVLEFSSDIPNTIQVKCECNYVVEAHIDKDVSLLVDVFCGPVFKGDLKTMQTDMSGIEAMSGSAADNGQSDFTDDAGYPQRGTLTKLSDQEALPYRHRIDQVISAIRSGQYSSVDELFTLDGLDVFNKLISYGKARIVGDQKLMFVSSNDEVLCRSVSMNFSFRNNNRQFVENVCFVFNSDTLIDGISFGLDKKATDDVLYHAAWGEYARKILIEFLENYKTAYALKRIDYLRQIFDDDALIIVGKVSEQPEESADAGQKYINNKYVQLYRKSKEEYMEQLEHCFNSNEFINIRFAENDIVKAGKGGEIYGIQIRQDYYSSNYGDTGYLFLMVDLNDPKQPIITVRVWMPERDPDFSGLPDFN